MATASQPESGRRNRSTEGRSLDRETLTQLRSIFGDGPRRPDLLIEYPHLIQDRRGRINADQMVVLAHKLGLSSVVVYEVASFYHHFDALREGQAALNTMRFFSRESCG